jgi:hypothetical protein
MDRKIRDLKAKPKGHVRLSLSSLTTFCFDLGHADEGNGQLSQVCHVWTPRLVGKHFWSS